MKIYITRHGETEWNKAGRMQGWKNSDLSEKGIENAKKLGESLNHVDFDCIYCSPLGRTIETAKCIRGNKNTEIITKEALKEMGFGLWEGMEHTKVKELYAAQHFNLWNKPNLYEPVQGESFEELLCRTREVLNEIMNSKHENILIVSHAILIKAIYAIIKNYSLEDFWNPPFMHDTCLTVLEIKNNEVSIILEADVSHLD
ncbi:histidine phosphatase family protein [Clostridium sp. CS001]|uniref:histidine phosphatase family protein n=1 Tax=Clostridium sp. CS001 TaxID=2880648 RepID=UPI001CF4DB90|nr:histidine phosphatase family protein [Clostridium sp. CS001]MCB2288931.1 histidine phosphatase family protein [Clostridium sp. CS001]